jgi:hypothetical protein
VLLLGHRRDSGPFGQQQFFGTQRVHAGLDRDDFLGEVLLAGRFGWAFRPPAFARCWAMCSPSSITAKA